MELTNKTYSQFQTWLYTNYEKDLEQLIKVLPKNAICGNLYKCFKF